MTLPGAGSRCFELDLVDGVAHLRLSRPEELNSMVREFWVELPRIVRQLDARGDVRALVISSTGRHFSAGMDLGVFTDGESALAGGSAEEVGRTRARLRQTALMLQDSFTALERARMPVLTAIQGGCIGGAVDMVCAADMRYASADAFFVIQEINIGMMADVGTLQRLPKQLPEAVVRELAYTGDRLPAARAERLGFVNGLFDSHEALVAGTLEVARRIASRAPLAVAASKEMISYARDHPVADAFAMLNALQPGIFDPADIRTAIAAQRAGTQPRFADLPPIRPAL